MLLFRSRVRILLVLQNNNRVGVSNGCFQKAFGVFRTPRCDDFQPRYAPVPSRVVLRMLCTNASCKAVRTTKGDVTRLNSAGHVVRLSGGVNDLINGLHGEIESHELALWKACLSQRQQPLDAVGKVRHTTGRSPARAAPTVNPQKPASVIGLSMTRFSPNRSSNPFVTLYLHAP